MDNISIISDNIYAKVALDKMISQLFLNNSKNGKIAIYTFEKSWIHECELNSILNCKAERIMILASKSLLNFFSTFNFPKNITFTNYEERLSSIRITITEFIIFEKIDYSLSKFFLKEQKKLTLSEQRVTLLYVEGLSIVMISKLMNKNYKTISSHKRNAMKKMGVSTNFELLQKKQSIILADKMSFIND